MNCFIYVCTIQQLKKHNVFFLIHDEMNEWNVDYIEEIWSVLWTASGDLLWMSVFILREEVHRACESGMDQKWSCLHTCLWRSEADQWGGNFNQWSSWLSKWCVAASERPVCDGLCWVNSSCKCKTGCWSFSGCLRKNILCWASLLYSWCW